MNGQQFDWFNSHTSAFSSRTKAMMPSKSTAGASASSRQTKALSRRQLKMWAISLIAIVGYTGGYLVARPAFTAASSEVQPTEGQTKRIGIRDRPLPVEVIELIPVNSYTIQREYTGEVKAARASNLGFELSGKLIALRVQTGDTVAAGQVIAQLDTQNLEAQRGLLLAQRDQAIAVLQELQNGPRQEAIAAARSNVNDFENQLVLQRTKQLRREYLYEEGVIAQESLDEAVLGAEALSDRLAAARSQLQELQTGTRPEQVAAQQAVISQIDAQIADLEITIAKGTIRAPYNGRIGDRLVDEGTVLNPGQAVVRLVEGASPEVEIGIPEDGAMSLIPGSSATVEIGGQTYRARIMALKPEIDTATRTRPLVLQLEATALQTVAPQQIARLRLEQGVATEGYWVPVTALVKGDSGLWATYAVVGAKNSKESSNVGIVERRDVEVLYTENERVLVRGTLEAGDRIIESGVQRIVPGQSVLVQSDS